VAWDTREAGFRVAGEKAKRVTVNREQEEGGTDLTGKKKAREGGCLGAPWVGGKGMGWGF